MLSSIQKQTHRGLSIVLLLLVSVLSACSQTLGSTTNNAATGNKLIVYLVGLGEQLDTKDNRTKATFYGSDGIEPYLQGPGGKFHDAASMFYSYRGLGDNGTSGTFPCTDTYNKKVFDNENLLNLEITYYLNSHPNTQVYLVSHSLGGVISFSFMAQLLETTHKNALPHGGSLQGVAILDSPLNGVTHTPQYQTKMIESAFFCSGEKDYTSISELQTLGDTGAFQGKKASILGTLLNGAFVPNQQVAEDAANAGVRLLIVGNTHDLLWQPDFCGWGPNFLSTQYLSEVGKTGKGAFYVRSITAPSGDLDAKKECSLDNLLKEHAHHSVVTTDNGVKKAIEEVFLGQDLNMLTPVTDSTMPVGLPTPTPQTGLTPGTWTGTETYNYSRPVEIQLILTSVSNGTFTGTLGLSGPGNSADPLQNGSTYDNHISFSIPTQVPNVVATYEGTISGNTISGVWHLPDGTGGNFTVTKSS